MPIKRLFVANRGEIAVRVLRTAKKLGIETVLGVSAADRETLGADLADRTVVLGPAAAAQSYLNAKLVVHAAKMTGCDALHPGYGFLSEKPELARLCEEAGVIFVGPRPEAIEALGDKLAAREIAEAAGVPLVPGTNHVGNIADAKAAAAKLGYPIVMKASAGGGGRGMFKAASEAEIEASFERASREAEAAFGDNRLYIERFVERARHVEVQIVGDGEGNVVHFGERDCSVQRRYQKLIEETPAPRLPDALRQELLAAGVRFARRLDYRGAGTVEFLVDAAANAFYFLEMNARIQVEHPVTEAVSGIDLVAEQIAIAGGADFTLQQAGLRLQGAAIECRINAEDPALDFRPSPGTVRVADWPSGEGVRVDTHITAGARVPPFYDSLLGKIIVHGPDRATALARLRRAIAATRIEGVATNLAFHAAVLDHPEFAHGGVDTGFLARTLPATPAPEV